MALKVIIDVDVGIDDAMALLMAIAHPSRCNILAITCVNGNVDLPTGYSNVLRILKLTGKFSIPAYKGCRTSVLSTTMSGVHYHGQDGLGGQADKYPVPGDEVPRHETHASAAMVDLVKKNPGEITLVALGPLTNLAMAQRLDPNFLRNIKELVIMGGTVYGIGNVTPVGEFNFLVDPEAANVVLGEVDCKTRILPCETCERTIMDWDWYDRWVGASTEKAKFIKAINAAIVHRLRDKGHAPGYYTYDPLTVMTVINPAAVKKSATLPAIMELRGAYTRGALIVDHRGRKTKTTPAKSFEFVLELNLDVVKKMFVEMVQ